MTSQISPEVAEALSFAPLESLPAALAKAARSLLPASRQWTVDDLEAVASEVARVAIASARAQMQKVVDGLAAQTREATAQALWLRGEQKTLEEKSREALERAQNEVRVYDVAGGPNLRVTLACLALFGGDPRDDDGDDPARSSKAVFTAEVWEEGSEGEVIASARSRMTADQFLEFAKGVDLTARRVLRARERRGR